MTEGAPGHPGELIPTGSKVIWPAVGDGGGDPGLEGGRPAGVVATEAHPDETHPSGVDVVSRIHGIDRRRDGDLVVVADGQLGADLALTRSVEAEHGKTTSQQWGPCAVTILLGGVEPRQEDHQRGRPPDSGNTAAGDAEQPGEVRILEGDGDLLDRGRHEGQDPVMAFHHLGQTVGMALEVVHRQEVGEVVTARRRQEAVHRGDAAPLVPGRFAHRFVDPGRRHPLGRPVGPVADPPHRRGQIAQRDVSGKKASRPDVENLLDDRIGVVEGAGGGGIDPHCAFGRGRA